VQGRGLAADASVSSTSSGIGIGSGSFTNHDQLGRSNSPTSIYRTAGVIMRHRRDLPWGIRLTQKFSDWCCPLPQESRDFWYRASVLLITFFSYTAYHLSRKPISIVKNVLNQNCSTVTPTPGVVVNLSDAYWCDWAPFNSGDADTLLGTLDSSFLFAYAVGMFFSGFIAERVNLRYFLSLGMLLSGFFTYLFGLAYTRKVHNLSYFILVQALAGLFQTTGWPGVVTIMGNWFGKGKRGLIFGLWNAHTSLGNILGSVIAGAFVEDNWGLSFIIPGAIVGLMGFLVFLFLVPKPQHVGCTVPDHGNGSSASSQASVSTRRKFKRNYTEESLGVGASISTSGEGFSGFDDSDTSSDTSDQDYLKDVVSEKTPMISNMPEPQEVKIKAVGFMEALKIPGVIEYSLCLFFAKLVSYTFLYWLPRYINTSTTLTPAQSANLSTLFDVGGILGGIIAGVISDYSGMSATTCAGMLTVAVPMLLVYENHGGDSMAANVVLLILVGLLVNGPYTLITTAVSTDLGTHPCLQGNARALATVTSIIDGTGSIGAAVGPLLAGPVSSFGWKYVFIMLIIADLIALVLLIRLMAHELKRFFNRNASVLKVNVQCEPEGNAEIP